MTISAFTLLAAAFADLAALTILKVTILLAVANNTVLRCKLRHVLVKVLYFVYFFTFQFTFLFRYFLLSDFVDEPYLVLARLAPASAVAEVPILETLAVAVQATLTVVTSRFDLRSLRARHVVIEELLEQRFSKLFVLSCSSTLLHWLSRGLFLCLLHAGIAHFLPRLRQLFILRHGLDLVLQVLALLLLLLIHLFLPFLLETLYDFLALLYWLGWLVRYELYRPVPSFQNAETFGLR